MPRLVDRLKNRLQRELRQFVDPPAASKPPPGAPPTIEAPEVPPKSIDEPSEPVDTTPGTAWGRQPKLNPSQYMEAPAHAKHPAGHLMWNVGDPVEIDADPKGAAGSGPQTVSAVHTGGPPRRLTREQIDAGQIPYRALAPGDVTAASGAHGTVAGVGPHAIMVRIAPHDVKIKEGALTQREQRLLKQMFERGGGYVFGFPRDNVIPLKLEEERVWADGPHEASLQVVDESGGAAFGLPDTHQPGMRVPKGGSSCANCKHLEADRTNCSEPNFIAWNGSSKIPAPADEYCSDWFDPRDSSDAVRTSGRVLDGGRRRGRDERPEEELDWNGLTIALEFLGGETRLPGEKNESELPPDWAGYGYFKGIAANDGDDLDVIVGPRPFDHLPVFIAAQLYFDKPEYQQLKVFIGFESCSAAESAFRQMWPAHMFAGMVEMDEAEVTSALTSEDKAKADAKRVPQADDIHTENHHDVNGQLRLSGTPNLASETVERYEHTHGKTRATETRTSEARSGLGATETSARAAKDSGGEAGREASAGEAEGEKAPNGDRPRTPPGQSVRRLTAANLVGQACPFCGQVIFERDIFGRGNRWLHRFCVSEGPITDESGQLKTAKKPNDREAIVWHDLKIVLEAKGGERRPSGHRQPIPAEWRGIGFIEGLTDKNDPDEQAFDVVIGSGSLDDNVHLGIQLDDGAFRQFKAFVGFADTASAEAAFKLLWPNTFGGMWSLPAKQFRKRVLPRLTYEANRRVAFKRSALLVMEVSPHAVEPPHEIKNLAKFDRLALAMREHGWDGRPILAYRSGGSYQALTGSHRIAAAREAGLEQIPILLIEDADFVENSTYEALDEADDNYDRLRALEQLREENEGTQDAFDLMTREIAEKNRVKRFTRSSERIDQSVQLCETAESYAKEEKDDRGAGQRFSTSNGGISNSSRDGVRSSNVQEPSGGVSERGASRVLQSGTCSEEQPDGARTTLAFGSCSSNVEFSSRVNASYSRIQEPAHSAVGNDAGDMGRGRASSPGGYERSLARLRARKDQTQAGRFGHSQILGYGTSRHRLRVQSADLTAFTGSQGNWKPGERALHSSGEHVRIVKKLDEGGGMTGYIVRFTSGPRKGEQVGATPSALTKGTWDKAASAAAPSFGRTMGQAVHVGPPTEPVPETAVSTPANSAEIEVLKRRNQDLYNRALAAGATEVTPGTAQMGNAWIWAPTTFGEVQSAARYRQILDGLENQVGAFEWRKRGADELMARYERVYNAIAALGVPMGWGGDGYNPTWANGSTMWMPKPTSYQIRSMREEEGDEKFAEWVAKLEAGYASGLYRKAYVSGYDVVAAIDPFFAQGDVVVVERTFSPELHGGRIVLKQGEVLTLNNIQRGMTQGTALTVVLTPEIDKDVPVVYLTLDEASRNLGEPTGFEDTKPGAPRPNDPSGTTYVDPSSDDWNESGRERTPTALPGNRSPRRSSGTVRVRNAGGPHEDRERTVVTAADIIAAPRWKEEGVDLPSVEDQLAKYVDSGYFVTFTAINKLGINPQSGYDTPLGIYCYPLSREIYDQWRTDDLPYVGNQPFIQLLRPRGDILDTANEPGPEWETHILNYLKKLGKEGEAGGSGLWERRWNRIMRFARNAEKSFPDGTALFAAFKPKLYKITQATVREAAVLQSQIVEIIHAKPLGMATPLGRVNAASALEKAAAALKELVADYAVPVEDRIEDGLREAKLQTPIGRVWNASRYVALDPYVWAHILQEVGIDGLNDGACTGIIHGNEPCQAVFFSLGAVEHIGTFENPQREENKNKERQMLWRFLRALETRNVPLITRMLPAMQVSKSTEGGLKHFMGMATPEQVATVFKTAPEVWRDAAAAVAVDMGRNDNVFAIGHAGWSEVEQHIREIAKRDPDLADNLRMGAQPGQLARLQQYIRKFEEQGAVDALTWLDKPTTASITHVSVFDVTAAEELPPFLYHVTMADRLSGIAAHGLVPNEGTSGTFSGYGARNVVFLTTADGASYWFGKIEDQVNYANEGEDAANAAPVVLRVPTAKLRRKLLAPDEIANRESISAEAWMYAKAIPARVLEGWDGQSWVRLDQLDATSLAEISEEHYDNDEWQEVTFRQPPDEAFADGRIPESPEPPREWPKVFIRPENGEFNIYRQQEAAREPILVTTQKREDWAREQADRLAKNIGGFFVEAVTKITAFDVIAAGEFVEREIDRLSGGDVAFRQQLEQAARQLWRETDDEQEIVDLLRQQRSKTRFEKRRKDVPGAVPVGETPEHYVVRVDTPEAAHDLGSQNWCIAREERHYQNYRDQGVTFYFYVSKAKGPPAEYAVAMGADGRQETYDENDKMQPAPPIDPKPMVEQMTPAQQAGFKVLEEYKRKCADPNTGIEWIAWQLKQPHEYRAPIGQPDENGYAETVDVRIEPLDLAVSVLKNPNLEKIWDKLGLHEKQFLRVEAYDKVRHQFPDEVARILPTDWSWVQSEIEGELENNRQRVQLADGSSLVWAGFSEKPDSARFVIFDGKVTDFAEARFQEAEAHPAKWKKLNYTEIAEALIAATLEHDFDKERTTTWRNLLASEPEERAIGRNKTWLDKAMVSAHARELAAMPPDDWRVLMRVDMRTVPLLNEGQLAALVKASRDGKMLEGASTVFGPNKSWKDVWYVTQTPIDSTPKELLEHPMFASLQAAKAWLSELGPNEPYVLYHSGYVESSLNYQKEFLKPEIVEQRQAKAASIDVTARWCSRCQREADESEFFGGEGRELHRPCAEHGPITVTAEDLDGWRTAHIEAVRPAIRAVGLGVTGLKRETKPEGESAVVVVRVPSALARMWPKDRGSDDDSPAHFTICYLKGPFDEAEHHEIARIVGEVAKTAAPIPVELAKGVEWFTTDNPKEVDKEIAHKGVHPETAERMAELHWKLVDALEDAGFEPSVRDEFKAHSTLKYCPEREYHGNVPEGGFTAREVELWGWTVDETISLGGKTRVSGDDVLGRTAAKRKTKRIRKKRRRMVEPTWYLDRKKGVAYGPEFGMQGDAVRLLPGARVLDLSNARLRRAAKVDVDALVRAVEEQAGAVKNLTALVERLIGGSDYDAVRTEDRLIVLNPRALEDAPKRSRWLESAA